MTNYGNTGQRYKMPKRLSAELQGDGVLVTLDCGHSYFQKPYWDSTQLEWFLSLQRERIGKRQRCNECWPAREVAG